MSQDMSVGVIKLKLGACLTAPTKRMVADLFEVGRLCNVARNAAVRWWERWREDHTDWSPAPVIRNDGNTETGRNGLPQRLRNEPLPRKVCVGERGELSGSTALYHAGRRAAPMVNSNLIAMVSQEVWSELSSQTPYNHSENGGLADYRWQAILMCEASRPCFRKLAIPASCKETYLCYEGECSGRPSAGVAERMVRCAGSGCVIRFPLWSREAGRKVVDVICRVEVRQLSRGYRKILRRLATKEWKMSDSELVYKDGAWWFHLAYKQPVQSLGLDAGRTAVLELSGKMEDDPLEISVGEKRWTLGDGRMLRARFVRLESRRRAMEEEHKVGVGKGHGRKRFYAKMRPVTRQTQNLARCAQRVIIATVLRFCQRFDCGRVVYREPSLPLRLQSWYARHGVHCNWTRFGQDLRAKLDRHGVELSVIGMGCAEFRERQGD